MTPDYKILASGEDITARIATRLISLSLSDEAGFKSDKLEITLDDQDNQIALPRTGITLEVHMGYRETGLVPMGSYVADEFTVKGPGDVLIIRAKAANLGSTFKSQKTREWDNVSIKDIVRKVAGEHGFKAQVSEAFRAVLYPHLDQTDESDMNLLTRLARELGAIATVKGETLLFLGRGEGRTASGQVMGAYDVEQRDCTNWNMTFTTRSNFSSVEAGWHDTHSGTRKIVTKGTGTPVKRLRHVFASQAEAERAAQAKLDTLARCDERLSLEMPGNPLLAAESRIRTWGFREGVSGTWSIRSARHRIASQGFTTSIETERPKSSTP